MNEQPTHLDLFSGIGGFALAAGWAGFKTIGFCEIEPYCQAVLKKHWPQVPIHSDIRKLQGKKYRGCSLLTGGFPCQPYSLAGKRRGKNDDRHLWPEMFRIIQEAEPSWIIGENVAGIIGMELERVLIDLESENYETQCFIIPACAVNAPHKRERIWIVANRNGEGLEGQSWHEICEREREREREIGSIAKNRVLDLWPTPSASEHKYRLKGKTQASKCLEAMARIGDISKTPVGKGGGLNPAFVEWLMGYPEGWTELKDWATPSSRKSPTKSSKASKK